MISRKWLPVILLDLLALLVAAASVLGQTAPKGPHVNGYWQIQPSVYVPCNAIKPFLTFVNTPGDGQTWYLQGDVTANLPHPSQWGQWIDAGYGNHSHNAYDKNGIIIPISCELCVNNAYPVPTLGSQLCTQWAAYNTAVCPSTSTMAQYSAQWVSNSVGVWAQSKAVYQPAIDADCSGPQPTNTPIRTATAVPTQPPTPTPGPNPYAQYIEALKRYGVSAGCGGGNFCPSFNITREQLATWLVKASQAGPMTLAPCMTPPAFNDVICNSGATAKVGP